MAEIYIKEVTTTRISPGPRALPYQVVKHQQACLQDLNNFRPGTLLCRSCIQTRAVTNWLISTRRLKMNISSFTGLTSNAAKTHNHDRCWDWCFDLFFKPIKSFRHHHHHHFLRHYWHGNNTMVKPKGMMHEGGLQSQHHTLTHL